MFIKKLITTILAIVPFVFPADLKAQHCPFDGYYTIAIRISKAGKGTPEPAFYLLEKEVVRKDTCSFTNRVDSARFLSEEEVRAEMAEDPRSTRSRYLPERLKKDHNFLRGNRVVFMGMSAKDCMVEKGNEYDYLPRQFVVRYTYNGRKADVEVPSESIFSLCGASGSWKRIKPLEVLLP